MSTEFEQLKEALRKPATPEAMQEAAAAFAQYRKVSLGSNSRPTLVRLRNGVPYSIDLKDIPQELERNPEFYEFMKKIVAKEK